MSFPSGKPQQKWRIILGWKEGAIPVTSDK
jgi:hypothetical protein